MQFWCETATLSTSDAAETAALLEDAGFAGLMAASGGVPESDAESHDARWSGIRTVAQATSSLRFMSNACIAGRDMVFEVARQWTALTPTTRRRVALSVSDNWMAEEFERFGCFDNVGPRLTEMIGALREETTPQLPVFGKGDSLPALRRAALCCEGWVGGPTPLSRVEPIVNTLLDHRRRSAPAGDTFEIVMSLCAMPSADACRHAEDSGVTGIVWSPRSLDSRQVYRAIETFAETVIARCG